MVEGHCSGSLVESAPLPFEGVQSASLTYQNEITAPMWSKPKCCTNSVSQR